MRGCCLRKRRSRGINQRAPKIGPTASVTVLRGPAAWASIAALISPKARLTTRASERPVSVRTTARVLRTKSAQPQSRSSSRMWLLIDVGLT